jgi:hypothetical protein
VGAGAPGRRQLRPEAAGRHRYEHVFTLCGPTSHVPRSCVLIINVPQLSRTRSGTDTAVLCAVADPNRTRPPYASRCLPDRAVGRAGGPGGRDRSVRTAGDRDRAVRRGAAGLGAGALSTGGAGMAPGAAGSFQWLAAEPSAPAANGLPALGAAIDGSSHCALRRMHHAGTSQAGFRPVGRRPDSPGIGRTPKGRQ